MIAKLRLRILRGMMKNRSSYKPHKTREVKTTNQRDRPRTKEGGV